MRASVTILGTSSAAPTRDRFHSGQYLKLGTSNILIDCGEGTQNRMLEYGLSYQKITHIFISHLHGDHYLGLPGLINTMSLNQRKKKLEIFGPSELKEILQLQFKAGKAHIDFPVEYHILDDNKEFECGDFHASSFLVKHRVPCYSFLFKEKEHQRKLNVEVCEKYQIPVANYNRIKEGESYQINDNQIIPNSELTFDPDPPLSYGYITDTLYMEELTEKFEEVNLLYHEATYLSNLIDRAIQTHHSTAEQAAQFARKCSANQLIIGHFSSRYENLEQHLFEAKEVFDNTLLAKESQTYAIG